MVHLPLGDALTPLPDGDEVVDGGTTDGRAVDGGVIDGRMLVDGSRMTVGRLVG